MAKVELKQPVVKEIAENIKDAQSVVVVNYRGLTVDQDTQLRKNLGMTHSTFYRYRKTFYEKYPELSNSAN